MALIAAQVPVGAQEVRIPDSVSDVAPHGMMVEVFWQQDDVGALKIARHNQPKPAAEVLDSDPGQAWRSTSLRSARSLREPSSNLPGRWANGVVIYFNLKTLIMCALNQRSWLWLSSICDLVKLLTLIWEIAFEPLQCADDISMIACPRATGLTTHLFSSATKLCVVDLNTNI